VPSASEDAAVVRFLHEAGQLSAEPRQGWLMAGVKHPESVAEHSHRAAVIAYVLAVLEGANPDRAAVLALFHDLPEARTGDLPSKARLYVDDPDPVPVVEDQVAGLPPAAAGAVRAAVAEFEGQGTAEAWCARDADKIDCLLRAREYQAQGYAGAEAWIGSMVDAVRTAAGHRLAYAARDLPADDWWRDIVTSYRAVPRPRPEPTSEDPRRSGRAGDPTRGR
jgi:5'-deoxynucleotidase YfbR-like HD superfamily hydrolase